MAYSSSLCWTYFQLFALNLDDPRQRAQTRGRRFRWPLTRPVYWWLKPTQSWFCLTPSSNKRWKGNRFASACAGSRCLRDVFRGLWINSTLTKAQGDEERVTEMVLRMSTDLHSSRDSFFSRETETARLSDNSWKLQVWGGHSLCTGNV